jgi:hypothetical protein
MSNLKNNSISTLNLWRRLILGEFNSLTLALTPKGKPNGLKDYNNLNKVDIDKVDTDNILSFINYITINK